MASRLEAFLDLPLADDVCRLRSQLFYFQQRGVGMEDAVAMIISGFCAAVRAFRRRRLCRPFLISVVLIEGRLR